MQPKPRPVDQPVPVQTGTGAQSGAQSVERALTLLSLVGRGGQDGLGLTTLCAETGLARPTARRLLMALAGAGLIEQDEATRRYHLGPETFLLGAMAAPRHGILAHAIDSLQRLAAATGDTAFISVPQGNDVLCLHREDGGFPIRTHALQSGDRNPLGVGAAGLAVLAAMPKAQADVVLARLQAALSQRMGAASAEVPGDVDLARARGYALNPGRVVPGSWALGVPVLWPNGTPAAALSLAAIETRMGADRQPQLIALLQQEARTIEASLASKAMSNRRSDNDPQ